MKSYKSLDQLVIQLIKQYASEKKNNSSMSSQYSSDILPFSAEKNASSDETSEIVRELVESINHLVQPYIESGLEVTANDPPDTYINISSGAGVVQGHYIEVDKGTKLRIPFDKKTPLFYVNFDGTQITVEPQKYDSKLALAKIVIPYPADTVAIEDDKPSETSNLNGWIVSGKDALFDGKWTFDDDSLAILGNKLQYILAKNVYGTLKLNENLTIENVQGTVKLDSKSLQLFYQNKNKASEFDRTGVRFYDTNGEELAKFTSTEARIGNIVIEPTKLHSGNYIAGSTGFVINDDGTSEFADVTVRGTIYAELGEIGGWTISSDKISSTSTGSGILEGGTIRTGPDVGEGQNGVIFDIAGVRGYSSTLGQVFNLPTDGSAPMFSSGRISETQFEISTNAVIRTSTTVGNGTANSAGILINDTGIYGCEANQLLQNANLKALVNGSVRLSGEVVSEQGSIGGVTITDEKLSGGLIEGSVIRGPIIETSSTLPKTRMDSTGIYYQTTSAIGKYGTFMYGDGTHYGAGVSAYIFKANIPLFSVMAEPVLSADIRLYNRNANPTTGSHALGDMICVNGDIRKCASAGSPGTFASISGTKRYGITITLPDASEDVCMTYVFDAITLSEVQAIITGTEKPSMFIDPYYTTSRQGGSQTKIFSTQQLIYNTGSGHNFTSFANATIPAHSWLIFKGTSSGAGTINEISMNMLYNY